jgi:hypothetical protein
MEKNYKTSKNSYKSMGTAVVYDIMLLTKHNQQQNTKHHVTNKS